MGDLCCSTCLKQNNIAAIRHALYRVDFATKKEIAEQCGISRSYVSRIEKKALQKLQTALGEYRL